MIRKFAIFLLSGVLCSAAVQAQQGRVVQSQAAVPGQNTSGSGTAANSDALLLLLEQNRNLQAEIQTLRSMVEEQGFQIRRLQQESMDRYTNTDARLSSLEQSIASGTGAPGTGGAGAAAINQAPASQNAAVATQGPALNGQSTIAGNTAASATPPRGISAGPVVNPPGSRADGNTAITSQGSGQEPAAGGTIDAAASASGSAINSTATSTIAANTTTNNAVSPGPAAIPPRPGLEPAVLTEQQLYQMAYDSAINSQFERAIAEFNQYLSLHPGGRFTTNAHYWKGQSYLYLSRFNEAIQSYNIILEQYPNDAKVPDAMYGLGVAYEGLGNTQRARQIMQDIRRRYPNTGVANLADTRLLSLD